PSLATVDPGGSATYSLSVSADTAVAGGVGLSITDLPAGVSASFGSPTIQVGESSTLVLSTTPTLAAGTYDLTITGTGGGLSRSVVVQLAVNSGEEPILTTISPDSFISGGHTRVTVTGQRLTGASLSIATEQTDPDNPVSRIFPGVQLISINAAGTSMEVDIDASDSRILDFYNLVVDNGVGKAAIQFRVLPPGPLVDAWTPAEPEVNHMYVLAISGRNLRGVTLSAVPAGRVSLFGVDASQADHVNALLEVPEGTPTGEITIIVSDSFGRQAQIPITIVPDHNSRLLAQNLMMHEGELASRSGSAMMPKDVYFQEFSVRDPDLSEANELGLRVVRLSEERMQLALRANKSFSFSLYVRLTYTLVDYNWQQAFLFDPLTGAIGDAVLQGLGLGDHKLMGAFILSFHVRIDLTVYFRLTNTGFSTPRFCIEITSGIEVTGFDGFAFNRSYCVFGGWHAFGTGSLDSGSIDGGDCAHTAPVGGPEQGFILADVQQSQCCAQPLSIAMRGSTFTGLTFGRSFDTVTPNAGRTTPNAECSCDVRITERPSCLVKGRDRTLHAVGTPSGGTYSWTVPEGSSHVSIVGAANSDQVQVRTTSPSAEAFDVTLRVVYQPPNQQEGCVLNYLISAIDAQTAFRASGQLDSDFNYSQVTNAVQTGLPNLGLTNFGSPAGATGFYNNTQVKGTVSPCDPRMECAFDLKRERSGVALMWDEGNQLTEPILPIHCPGAWCNDDQVQTDEDLLQDGPPGCGIYSLDTPGFGFDLGNACGLGEKGFHKLLCLNFREWVTVDGEQATDYLPWFASVRLRCDGSVWSRVPGGTGNVVGPGALNCDEGAVTGSAKAFVSPVERAQSAAPAVRGERSVADLLAELRSKAPSERIEASRALARLGIVEPLAAAERSRLVEGLMAAARITRPRYPVDSTPALALELLGRLQVIEGIPLLLERVLDDFPRVQPITEPRLPVAAEALTALGSAAVRPILERVSSASEEEWRVLSGVLKNIANRTAVRQAIQELLQQEGGSTVAARRLAGVLR
ncbi:MAG: hypothetical protein U0002_22010, partial [Thermoanaerobaculia bacterium]